MDAASDSISAGQADYQPLVEALGVASGFSLLLVECNAPLLRKHLLNALERDAGRPLIRVDVREALLDADRSAPLDQIVAEAVAAAPEDAVISLSGLEAGLPSDDPERTARTLQELNFRRSAYQRLGRPLLLWLPIYAMKLFARQAPDFHDWYSGTFVFGLKLKETALKYRHVLRTNKGIQSLPAETRKQMLATLLDIHDCSDQVDDKQSLALLLFHIAELELSFYQHESAIAHSQEAATYFESVKNYSVLADINSRIIDLFLALNKNKEAVSLAQNFFVPYFNKYPDEQAHALTNGKMTNALLLSRTLAQP